MFEMNWKNFFFEKIREKISRKTQEFFRTGHSFKILRMKWVFKIRWEIFFCADRIFLLLMYYTLIFRIINILSNYVWFKGHRRDPLKKKFLTSQWTEDFPQFFQIKKKPKKIMFIFVMDSNSNFWKRAWNHWCN